MDEHRVREIVKAKFTVGVFTRWGQRKRLYSAYVRDYNPQWDGCCEHDVEAENGEDAKRRAIELHKAGLASGLGCGKYSGK